MPTELPARDPFRPLALHRTRRDKNTVLALLLLSALLTLGTASVTHTARFSLTTDRAA